VTVLARRGLGKLAALGGQVQEQSQDLGAGEPVDQRVVDLREHRRVARLETVDQVQLPQRPRPIERAREDPRHLLGKLLVVPRRDQRELADVEVQVEVLVVEPVGVVQPERDLHEPPAHRREQRQPLCQERLDVGAGDRAARAGRRVEDRQPAHVPGLARRLEREELRVQARELTHQIQYPAFSPTLPAKTLPPPAPIQLGPVPAFGVKRAPHCLRCRRKRTHQRRRHRARRAAAANAAGT
jgi:hypothetical protein